VLDFVSPAYAYPVRQAYRLRKGERNIVEAVDPLTWSWKASVQSAKIEFAQAAGWRKALLSLCCDRKPRIQRRAYRKYQRLDTEPNAVGAMGPALRGQIDTAQCANKGVRL